MSTNDNETLDRARAAWHRVKEHQSWLDWLLIGNALTIGRTECMHESQANHTNDGVYRIAYGKWLDAAGFGDMDKGVRSRLFKCMDNIASIEAHLQSLTATKRMTLNHPNSVLRHWYNNSADGRVMKEGEDEEKGGGQKRKIEKKKADEDRSKWVINELEERLAKTGDWEHDTPITILQKLEDYYPSTLADIVTLALGEKATSHGGIDWEEDPVVVRQTMLATLPQTIEVNRLLREIADHHSEMLKQMGIAETVKPAAKKPRTKKAPANQPSP